MYFEFAGFLCYLMDGYMLILTLQQHLLDNLGCSIAMFVQILQQLVGVWWVSGEIHPPQETYVGGCLIPD